MPEFQNFVVGYSGQEKVLPVAHNCDVRCLVKNITQPKLNTAFRSEYSENLLFFFYGRPAYRLHPNLSASSIEAVHLVAYILDPEKMPPPHRIVAFDSGAMEADRYTDAMHPEFTKLDFEIGSDIVNASRLVSCFFGSNKNYLAGQPINASIPATELVAKSYYALIQTPLASDVDDRKSTVEVQYNSEIKLEADNVLAVILPGQLLDDSKIENFITHDLAAEPIPYHFYRARPSDDTRVVMELAFQYYQRTGRL
ncbi:hypothetical protein [Hyphomonas sp. KY3]|uniref:hypothetical protein n=1 Tax=Hyphomonas sp. KY3 TaxID=2016196 RepID=UPI001A8D3568|nr:hypothetical protein [Hyphomonas sp. KY3]